MISAGKTVDFVCGDWREGSRNGVFDANWVGVRGRERMRCLAWRDVSICGKRGRGEYERGDEDRRLR